MDGVANCLAWRYVCARQGYVAIQLGLVERIGCYEILVFTETRIAMDVAVVKIAASIYQRL